MASEDGLPYGLLLPQALIGLVDALSFMVTSPSLVFYVLQAGGTYQQYGAILSVFSLSSFLCKPVLGLWCDKNGGKFRLPYLTSVSIAAIGGFVYFLASGFQGTTAIALIFIGRLLGGAGAANQTLGFTYIAQVMPKEKLTQASAVLSMVRIVGMSVAPGLNVLMSKIGGEINLGSLHFKLDPLNSVGLFIAGANMITLSVVLFVLKEPPQQTHEKRRQSIDAADERSWTFWKCIFSPDILLPMLSIFYVNASFQLMETCLAPAANDAVGLGTVGVSSLFGASSIFIFIAVITTFRLSSRGVKDETLLKMGLGCSTVGYLALYLLWKKPTDLVRFAFPVVLATFGFPFLGSPTRSLFTRAVDGDTVLRNHQGTMQALLSMISSLAGFTAPGLISVYVLRTPEEVAASGDQRELGEWALLSPALGLLTLAGFVYLDYARDNDTSVSAEETDSLVPDGTAAPRVFHPKVEAYRRDTVTLMGIPQFSFSPFANNTVTRRHTTMLTSASLPRTAADSRRVSTAF